MNYEISVPDRFTSASFCDFHKFKSLPFTPRSFDKLMQHYKDYEAFASAITETISETIGTVVGDNILFMLRDFTKTLGIRWLEMRGSACTCPYCHQPAKSNGSVRGKTKFTCRNVELHEDGKVHSFNPDTSFEAQVFWYLSTILSLGYVAAGLTYKMVSNILVIPKIIVEVAVKIGGRTLKSHKPKIHAPDTVIFIDESGAFFRGALIAACVNDKVYIRLATIPTNLDLKLFFKELKEMVDSERIVVITDGKPDYVTLVEDTWPNAIHVAQFHERDVLGQVHVYFQYNEKRYTIRMPWDVFITTETHESILLPAEQEVPQRDKKSRVGVYRVAKITLFEGRVRYPYRPKPGRNPTRKVSHEEKEPTSVDEVKQNAELSRIKIPADRSMDAQDKKKEKRAKIVAEVEPGRWRTHPIISYALSSVEKIFRGKHITSYRVENVFSIVKPLMYIHRAERNVLDLAKVLLFFYSLRQLTWYQILTEIAKGLPFSLFVEEFKKRRACTRRRKRVEVKRNGTYDIVYVRRYGGHEVKTKRRIVVRAIWKRGSRIYIHAFCMLRNAPRVFLASRIIQIREVRE